MLRVKSRFSVFAFIALISTAYACSDSDFSSGNGSNKGATNGGYPPSTSTSTFTSGDGTQIQKEYSKIDTATGLLDCNTLTEDMTVADWEPQVNAPAGYLYGRSNPANLKITKSGPVVPGAADNVVLASAPNLAVGAKFPNKSFLLSSYEIFNDTGVKSHFGNSWAVEVSMDGAAWNVVEPSVTGVLGAQSYNFAKPVLASYVRLRLNGLPYGDGWDVWWLRFTGKRVECK